MICQTVWMRELRLVFGASTAASSAVTAIFIAGLGFGGLWLGRRLEHNAAPLRSYARLELAVGVLSVLTPWQLDLVRALYIASGGSPRLGVVGSTLLRLLLTCLVLLPPAWLMGGTLPAVARAVSSEADRQRRAVAWVYALNTLGAVVGCALSTFLLLESLGNRVTLYLACGLNALVGAAAYALSKRTSTPAESSPQPEPQPSAADTRAVWFSYASAAVVGFAFFLMELVWYRVLGPLLGGSVFTFGLILCVALTGIGLGSASYAAFSTARPRVLLGFALSCAAEAVAIALPYALGDRLAMTALLLQPFQSLGFGGTVLGWLVVALCVVFPVAVVSGIQFPLLIALLGTGRKHVGRDVAYTYAANTLGAIVGALAGGFGLLPLLGAIGCWRLGAALLVAWSLLAACFALWQGAKTFGAASAVVLLCVGGGLLLTTPGPSDAFRHAPIGIGRVPLTQVENPNAIEAFLSQERRSVDWQADGVESAVAITHYDGLAFVVNGKSDGSALTDSPTQVMGGLLGAALLPRVKKALVIGLGTGSTAGWLASLPEIERVDVAEIEPVIAEVAKRCARINQGALDNPKLHVLHGDARELLSVLQDRYDVIFSEPSNPYRAGVASMYAHEFYGAVRERLQPDGLFVQWLQAYDVDASSVRTIYATLAATFPHLETWNGLKEDLLLVASQHALTHDVAALRLRLAQEPFVSALRLAWSTEGLEGFLGHFVANETLTKTIVGTNAPLDTDDLSPVEFGFARHARGETHFTAGTIFTSAIAREAERPVLTGEPISWARVDYEREVFGLLNGSETMPELLSPAYKNRFTVLSKWLNGDFVEALRLWPLLAAAGEAPLLNLTERLARAELLAYEGSIEAEREIERLLLDRPTEAALLHAIYLLRHAHRKAGTELLDKALELYRHDPWPYPVPMARALSTLQMNDDSERGLAERWLQALEQPFALRVNETARDRARLRLAYALGAAHRACVEVLESFEPYPPWTEEMLKLRVDCYDAHRHTLRERAATDLARFRAHAPASFESLLAR